MKGGGVLEVVKALQAGLAARGHDAIIITPRHKDVTKEYKNVRFLGSSSDVSFMGTTPQISGGIDKDQLEEFLDAENFDVLHFHEPWVPMLSPRLVASSQCVNVATFHAKLPESVNAKTMARVVQPYTKSVLNGLHELTAVSEAAVDHIEMLTDQDITVIPNGINLKEYSVPTKTSDRSVKQILYIGRLERRKGVKYLIKAFAELVDHDKKVSLLIAGDGIEREKLERLVAYLGIEKNVKFLGYITEARKHKLLQSADLFCSPALYGESFGIVLLEAMASGLVTVAGDNPGYTSVMKGVGSLSLVNPRHTSEFAKRLQLLLYEEELRALWKKWAKESIGQYDYDMIVQQYEKVYKAAIAKYAK